MERATRNFAVGEPAISLMRFSYNAKLICRERKRLGFGGPEKNQVETSQMPKTEII